MDGIRTYRTVGAAALIILGVTAVFALGGLGAARFADSPRSASAPSAGLSAAASTEVADEPATKSTGTAEPAAGSNAAQATPDAAEVERAESIVAQLAKTYRHLEGVTVTFGTTPDGQEAVAYYTEGQIVISTAHKVEIDKILAHEVWHIIDWRDNGRMDWGEDLPPDNSSDYLL